MNRNCDGAVAIWSKVKIYKNECEGEDEIHEDES